MLGMLLAIGGDLFMGCAAFISKQHAMISHVIRQKIFVRNG